MANVTMRAEAAMVMTAGKPMHWRVTSQASVLIPHAKHRRGLSHSHTYLGHIAAAHTNRDQVASEHSTA